MKSSLLIAILAAVLTICAQSRAWADDSCQIADKAVLSSGNIITVVTKESGLFPPYFKPNFLGVSPTFLGVSIDWMVVTFNAPPCKNLFGHGAVPNGCADNKSFRATGKLIPPDSKTEPEFFVVEDITCS